MAILLEEYFNGTLADWTVTDEADATSDAPSAWSISATDFLTNTSNIGGAPVEPRRPGSFITYDNGASWTLYTANARIASNDNDTIGMVVYYQDVDNYIQYRTSSQDGTEVLWKKVAGVQTFLASGTFSYGAVQWLNINFTLASGTVNVKRDGIQLFGGDVVVTDIASGTVGFFTSFNDPGFYDTMLVDDNIVDDPDIVGPKLIVVPRAFNQSTGMII